MRKQDIQPRISAFTPPPGGILKVGDQVTRTRDFRTAARYREYARCGFEEILFAGENKYTGEPFETSELKKMLDLAADANLRAIVFDERLLRLTVDPKEKIVGELFASRAELEQYVADCLRVYAEHPAFYGISAADEPRTERAGIFSEFCAAVHAFRKDIYIHTCFLPMANGDDTQASAGGTSDVQREYSAYIDAMCASGLGYFAYDAYPFGMWEGKNDMRKGYVRNMQIVARRSAANGVPFYMTIQSFSSGANDELRRVDESDLNWQTNMALGFGCKKLYYFTYWRFTTRSSADFFTSAIMDEDGRRLIYDAAKRNNKLFLQTLEKLDGYTYVRSQYCGPAYKVAKWLESEPIDAFRLEAPAPVLINELTDGSSRVFMILNLRDPYEKEDNVCRLEFQKETDSIRLFRRGRIRAFRTPGSALIVALAPGEAVWLFSGRG